VTWKRDNEEKGRRVREARDAKGLTQKQVAAAIGTTASTISHIESGTIGVTRERAVALEQVLGVPADDLADVIAPSLLARLDRLEARIGDDLGSERGVADGLASIEIRLGALEETVARSIVLTRRALELLEPPVAPPVAAAPPKRKRASGE